MKDGEDKKLKKIFKKKLKIKKLLHHKCQETELQISSAIGQTDR